MRKYCATNPKSLKRQSDVIFQSPENVAKVVGATSNQGVLFLQSYHRLGWDPIHT